MNTTNKIDYWRTGSDEDWEVAVDLIQRGKLRHGLFFLHLSLEKILKAHVCRVTEEDPPKIHNLLRLMQRANLALDVQQSKLLAELNSYCLEGRYATELGPPPSPEEAARTVRQAEEVRTWLIRRL
ncbi:MAG: HEPN domain-containing protein [Magnetococcales bacterium]|nr:HEPN domain-containing protein [Magnetococcales bacterium]